MALFRNLLEWSYLRNTGDNQQTPNTLVWDEFPYLVQLEILKNLDRQSLNNLRQISASARDLIENEIGIHVIIPARNWAYIFGRSAAVRKVVTDVLVHHIAVQMEGKRIHTFEMNETPPQLSPFPFTRLIKYPRGLLQVKLKFVDVDLLHSILSHCPNLKSFEYKTGFLRPMPHGGIAKMLLGASYAPVVAPSTNGDLIEKVHGFQPNLQYQLANLRELSLTIFELPFRSDNDWGNVIYLLLGLPSLPSLATMQFSLHPGKWRLAWKTHVVILSVFAEFLSKTPNLQDLRFQSSYVKVSDLLIFGAHDRLNTMRSLIRNFGSDLLKEVGDATEGTGPLVSFLMLTRQLFQVAARSLVRLNKLNIETNDDSENHTFTDFVSRIPSRVPLATFLLKDDTTPLGNDTQLVTEAEKSKLYKLLTFPIQDENPQRHQPLNPIPAYRHLTEVDVQCNFQPNTTLSLNHIVERMPLLKSLAIVNLSTNVSPVVLHFNTHPGQTPFARLERLSMKNLSIGSDQDPEWPASSTTVLVMQCRNLRELSIRYTSLVNYYWSYHVQRGVPVKGLLCIMASLPKLRQLRMDKIYSPPVVEPPGGAALATHDDQRGINALQEVGGILRQCLPPKRYIYQNDIFVDVTEFDFFLNEEMPPAGPVMIPDTFRRNMYPITYGG